MSESGGFCNQLCSIMRVLSVGYEQRDTGGLRCELAPARALVGAVKPLPDSGMLPCASGTPLRFITLGSHIAAGEKQ